MFPTKSSDASGNSGRAVRLFVKLRSSRPAAAEKIGAGVSVAPGEGTAGSVNQFDLPGLRMGSVLF